MAKEDENSTDSTSEFSTLEHCNYFKNLATFGGLKATTEKRGSIRRSYTDCGSKQVGIEGRSSFSASLRKCYNEAFAKKRLGNDLLPKTTCDLEHLQYLLNKPDRKGPLDMPRAPLGKRLSESSLVPRFEHTTWIPTESGICVKDQLTYPVFLRWGIIDHRSRFFYFWNISSVITNVCNAIIIPLFVGFYYVEDSYIFSNMDGYDAFFFVFILCSTIQNFTDVLVRSNLTFYTPGGRIVSNRETIIRTYLRSWFIIDALAGFPYQFFSINNGPPTYGYFELLRLVKFLRILTTDVGFTSAVICGFLMQHGLNISLRKLALLRSLLLLIIVIHIIACGAYIISNYMGSDAPWISLIHTGVGSRREQYTEAFFWATMTATTIG